jgi:ribosome maturation factor RimP
LFKPGGAVLDKESLSRAFLAIEKIVAELGYECVNAALATEDGRPVLRVMIDSIGGINVGDCETVSRAVNRFLDSPDTAASEFGDKYYLEISSPGLERPLFAPADYKRFRGKEARVKTGGLVDGRKTHVGFIADSDDGCVTLDTEQGARTIKLADVTRATLIFRGLTPQPPKKGKKRIGKPNRVIEEEHVECS